MIFGFATAQTVPLTTTVMVDQGEYRIAGHTMGKGVPVVAIPGGPGFSGRALWSFAYSLKDVAAVTLFDQLGTGESIPTEPVESVEKLISLDGTIRDLEALRKRLGHKKWTVFGQSWGVYAALAYVSKHPQSVDRLILSSAPGFKQGTEVLAQTLDQRIPTDEMVSMLNFGGQQNLSEDEKLSYSVLSVLPYYFYAPAVGKELGATAPASLFSPKVFRALSLLVSESRETSRGFSAARRWRGKALILQGHHDPCGAAMGYILKEDFLPNAKVVMIGQAGHFPWMENGLFFHYELRKWWGLPLTPSLAQVEKLKLEYGSGSDIPASEKEEVGWPWGRS